MGRVQKVVPSSSYIYVYYTTLNDPRAQSSRYSVRYPIDILQLVSLSFLALLFSSRSFGGCGTSKNIPVVPPLIETGVVGVDGDDCVACMS
jgi:hypothetical protein